MNNQFTGSTAWNDYILALENNTPVIEAIAVTDYYITDTYLEVLGYQASGRLPNVKLVFPNVELRLDVATAKGGFVNLHLLVSPDDPDHISELHRFLSRIQFRAFEDCFDCTKPELVRLGKMSDSRISDDQAALRHGASQFKVNFNQIRELFEQSRWAKENILVAVAGGASDGTSGVRGAADQTIRAEIERFADVIFASSSAQREFWLGLRAMGPDDIRTRYRSLKPCLHGSDAHKLNDVGVPDQDRFSWIKGGLEFDALRQACIDPEGRAFVGSEPPSSASPSQVISAIEVKDAPWLQTPTVPLNPRLVAVIGARGSGKTALADIIAAGCGAFDEADWNRTQGASPSFLVRAQPLLGEASVAIHWESGEVTTCGLDIVGNARSPSDPRVRYLSQRFVEDLCSSTSLSDGLLREIERVIFEAHPDNERDGALDFDELLDRHASRHRLARTREAEAVAQISERISVELAKDKLLESYENQVKQKKATVDRLTADRSKLVSKGSEGRAKRHTELAGAADTLRAKLRGLVNQRQTFLDLNDEVGDHRRNYAPELLRQTQARYSNSGLNAEQWSAFLLDYKGDVDNALQAYVQWADSQIAELKGTPPVTPDPANENTPLISDDCDLSTVSLAMLEAEMSRLERLVTIDKATQRRYKALSNQIAVDTAGLQSLSEKLEDARGAKTRARLLSQEREEAYRRAFEALVSEQTVLEDLYAPLMARLQKASGTLGKLSFSVSRVADVAAWAGRAEEELIDLRKAGAFRGRGTLLARAREVLEAAWGTGTAADAVVAMQEFRRLYQEELLAHSPMPHNDQAAFRAWSKRFAQWLFSTDHIGIHYGIEYDGVDIRKLSPGTRGIVLLLLYLALDDADARPLIIDQPEENLDPKSVFDELVSLFLTAKTRRQVIIVTHNANLVVNTDADQIIVATAGPHPHGSLPPISYVSGGLENASIRQTVCNILEGGEIAFQERARRLRVRLER